MSFPTNPNELLEMFKASFKEVKDSNDPSNLKYVIYVRKSTDEENKQVRSLDDQMAECKEFAERHNLKVVAMIREATSAKEPDIRPKFREMLNGLKSGKYDGVLSWHPDRLARNMKDAGEVIDLVDKSIIKDLKFVSFTFQNDTSGKMLLGITFVLSKEYSDKLSDNVTRANIRSLLEGKYINKAKHGYIKDRNQFLRPDGNNFVLIKQAFQLRLEGKTLDEITAFLNKSSYYHANTETSKRSEGMTKQRLQVLLKDPVYTGVLMYGKDNAVNLMELYEFVPVVSVEDFMTINKFGNNSQLISLAKSYRKGEEVKASLMKGMVICSECEDAMVAGITSKKSGGKTTNYFYYRCDNNDCVRYGKSLRAKVIIKYICDYLETKPFSSKESYDHYVEEMKRVSLQHIVEAKTKFQNAVNQKRFLEEKLNKTKELLLSDEDEDIKAYYRGDLKKYETSLKENTVELNKAKELVEKGKTSILTYSEFIELVEKIPKILPNIKNMNELDYIIRKTFLNFYIQGKNVYKSTLNHPFDGLETKKVLNGARERT